MKGSAETVQRQVRRLVALLLALAHVAERAAGRPEAVQRLVAWLLRTAEAVARDHVLHLTGQAACAPAPTVLCHAGAAEALRLAASFRALAGALSSFFGAPAMSAIPDMRSRAGAGQAVAALNAVLAGRSPTVERRDSS